jgi:DNA primase
MAEPADTRGRAGERARLAELRDEVRRAIDYRTFFQRYCPNANVSGSRLHALCPLPSHRHSGKGSPSLSVDLSRGLFHCFSRDEGGDAFKFYELMHSVTFGRAVREMARELGVGPSRNARRRFDPRAAAPDAADVSEAAPGVADAEEEPLPRARVEAVCEKFLEVCRAEDQIEGRNYLARRGIDARTCERARVAYFPRRAYRRVMRRMLDAFSPEELRRGGLFNRRAHLTFYRHRLLFPFLVEGRAVYLQARTTASGVEPRWHNMRGVVPALYNSDSLAALPSGATVHLVEGFTDTLTLLTHDFNAVGIVGAGGLKEDWLAPLARFRVVAALDPDAAGRRAAERYAELFAARGMPLAAVSLPSDVNDFFRQRASAALEFSMLTEAALERAGARRGDA